MYNILNKLRLVSAHCSKCIALKSVQFPYRWKSSTVAIPEQSVVISNLCEKLKCSEVVAKNIYDGCPTLRSIDAIRNDSLQLLCTKLSLLSVVENPELMTIDVGKNFFNQIHKSRITYYLSNCFRYTGTEN